MKRVVAVLSLASLGATCGDTVGERTELALRVAGTAPAPIVVDDVTVELTRAELGFGPLVLCATTGADLDLCPVAQGELRTSVAIDALDPEVRDAAAIEAVTTTVRSAAYDYGRSFLLTESRVRATDGAPEGHSLVLEADVARGPMHRIVMIALDIDPQNAGDPAVRGAATEHAITLATRALVVHVDAGRWAADVDWAPFLDEESDVVVVEPGDVAYDAIAAAMTSSALPTLEWIDE